MQSEVDDMERTRRDWTILVEYPKAGFKDKIIMSYEQNEILSRKEVFFLSGVFILGGIGGILLSRRIIYFGRKVYDYGDKHINDFNANKIVLRLLKIIGICLGVIGFVGGSFASIGFGLGVTVWVHLCTSNKFEIEKFSPATMIGIVALITGIFYVAGSLHR
jgi:hypothetical protein